MSQLAANERYAYDEQYKLWQIAEYNHGTGCWQHKQWMPYDWRSPPSEEGEEEEEEEEEDEAQYEPEDPEQDGDAISTLIARVTRSQGNAAAAGPGAGQCLPTHPEYEQTSLVNCQGEVSKIDPKHLPPVAPPPAPPSVVVHSPTWNTAEQGSIPAGGTSQPDPSIRAQWNAHYQKWCRQRYNYETGQWNFLDWSPYGHDPQEEAHYTESVNSVGSSSGAYPLIQQPNLNNHSNLHQSQHSNTLPRGKGPDIRGAYQHGSPKSLHYELIDPSFFVRSKSFFHEGKVFSVIMNETAGSTAATPHATDYNTSISAVKYQDNLVYTNVRRFVVVRQKREFCFACPIFTYSGRGTTKHGVQASEHGIAYSWGSQAALLPGEYGITKPSLAVVMTEGEKVLDRASRIYYGIHHPIQYNVKVKDVGYVVPDQVHSLILNWKAEDGETKQSGKVTANAEVPQGGYQRRPDTEREDVGEDDGGGNYIDNQDGGDDDDVQGGAEEMEQVTQTLEDTTIQEPLIVDSTHYASSQSAQPENSKRRSAKEGKRRKK